MDSSVLVSPKTGMRNMIAVIISAAITSPMIEVTNAAVAVPFCCGFIFSNR